MWRKAGARREELRQLGKDGTEDAKLGWCCCRVGCGEV